ncbi:MAG TPA: DUF4149 domain-containing protein [Terriglobales bacterium]|jgi:hypothetical protein|nr:DUF4149 domain-containing protein [Terriglobales bacterium]
MSFLRFLMLLSLIVWLGGVIFFPVVAQTSFSVLPTRHLAGSVVGRSLGILHWMGMISAVVFLASSLLLSRLSNGEAQWFAARNVLICIMLLLTLISQFGIIPRMDAIRASIGEIDAAPIDSPARVQFDGLHHWSTRIEGGVLLLGLAVAYLTARSLT